MDENNIKDLLPSVLTEAISEEGLSKLSTEIGRLIESKVQERVDHATQCAETAFNEAANTKLQKLVVTIDETYKKAFMRAYNVITEDYDNEISKVKRFFNSNIKRDSIRFKENLIESLSNYVDCAIDKMLPTKQIRKAIKNDTAMQVLESIKDILAVDKAAAMKAAQKPLKESVIVMDKQGKKIDRLVRENTLLHRQLNEANREAYLNEKMATLTEDAKNFVRKTLEGASLEYIKENFDYTLKHYKDNLARERETLAKKTMNERIKVRKQIPRIQLTESKKQIEKPVETNPHKAIANDIINRILS